VIQASGTKVSANADTATIHATRQLTWKDDRNWGPSDNIKFFVRFVHGIDMKTDKHDNEGRTGMISVSLPANKSNLWGD